EEREANAWGRVRHRDGICSPSSWASRSGRRASSRSVGSSPRWASPSCWSRSSASAASRKARPTDARGSSRSTRERRSRRTRPRASEEVTMKGLALVLIVGGWVMAVGGLVATEAMMVRTGAALAGLAVSLAIIFVWTLVAGFLVMFMQAGFALVETGLCRAKNANHTMMMNFMVYGFGMFAYWVMGFALQQGGSAGITNLGGLNPLNGEFKLSLFGKDWGLFGTKGFFLSGGAYDVGIMVMFLFQMVFMDTATTIVTGTAAERWKFAAFAISTFFLGAITYPLFGNWAWGGGWLSQLGGNFKLGHGYCDFAGSGVVHSVGGLTALAVAMVIGPRIGKFNRDGSPNAIPGHDITMVLLGCFILAFGWFGFNPGSTLGASGAGNLRISSIAVNTMLAGATGSFAAVL